eukprot:scaffold66704_cov33-Tisochrysis_lutea.AAC.1
MCVPLARGSPDCHRAQQKTRRTNAPVSMSPLFVDCYRLSSRSTTSVTATQVVITIHLFRSWRALWHRASGRMPRYVRIAPPRLLSSARRPHPIGVLLPTCVPSWHVISEAAHPPSPRGLHPHS